MQHLIVLIEDVITRYALAHLHHIIQAIQKERNARH
jgi:hypothetical protein